MRLMSLSAAILLGLLPVAAPASAAPFDGRWIAEIADIPGVLAYGRTQNQAKANAYALALRVIADRVEKSKTVPESISLICAWA